VLTCRHCLTPRHELYDCPPKGSNPRATCGCAEFICRQCALEQGVQVRATRSKADRAADAFESERTYW